MYCTAQSVCSSTVHSASCGTQQRSVTVGACSEQILVVAVAVVVVAIGVIDDIHNNTHIRQHKKAVLQQ
jgi:hypothetical protein